MAPPKVAVVTGSNKGIGFAVVKTLLQHPFDGLVYLTARDVDRGQAALKELEKLGLKPRFHQLDITSPTSVAAFRDYIKNTYGGLDVLVNNAAIAFSLDAPEPFGVQAKETVKVNYFDTLAFCGEIFPLLRKGARVSNVSSSFGHLSQIPGEELRKQLSADDLIEDKLSELLTTFVKQANDGTHVEAGWPNSTYKVSKVGLSALTRIQQRYFDKNRPGDDILVNHCHPGYVDTDMSSHKGTLSIEQGAVAPTYLALLPPGDKLRGGYVWHDKRVVDWVNGPLPAPY